MNIKSSIHLSNKKGGGEKGGVLDCADKRGRLSNVKNINISLAE